MLKQCLMLWMLGFVFAANVQSVEVGKNYDVLNLSAPENPRALESRLFGIAKAGSRLVMVGQRGLILYSDDNAETWAQAQVPVRSVLLSVFFVGEQKGWAVGHDGVILSSIDGGLTWVKQLDGYQLNDLALEHYRVKAQENPDNEAYEVLVGEFEFAQEQGADKPFLSVVFSDENNGYAMGAYGLAVVTQDGGANWAPIMELGEQRFAHLFDYEAVGEHYYLTSEMGQIYKGKIGEQAKLDSIIPFYDGSFYTITSSTKGGVIVAGLRANAFRSVDDGATWQVLSLPTEASINASLRLENGTIALCSQSGELLLSSDDGESFKQFPLEDSVPCSDMIEAQTNQIILVGLGGIKKIKLH